MHLITTLRRLSRSEDGFTMVVTMGVLLVVTMFSVAAFAAADGDIKVGADDKERKAAYAAAEAGVHDYFARLIADTDYWNKCDDLDPVTSAPRHLGLNAVNPGAARRWLGIPNSTAQYSIEVLPANGAAKCLPATAEATFIDTNTGTFRIRATGRPYAASKERRSIIATFRRRGFLDYIYFTDFETQNPAFYAVNTGGAATHEGTSSAGRDIVTWAKQQCARYWHEGRNLERFDGEIWDSGDDEWDDYDLGCQNISFVSDDAIKGPMHSNDSVLLCGNPWFGRKPSDDMETSGPGAAAPVTEQGWRQGCSGGQTPRVNYPETSPPAGDKGTWRRNSPLVKLPPSNASVKDDALPSYRFRGKTTIVLNGSNMTVTGKRLNGTVLNNATIALPTDGVISVLNDSGSPACGGYNALDPLAAPNTCGDAWVSGTYGKNLTITAENDIVIQNDLLKGSNAFLLGLISNNMIRVHHPVTGGCGDNTGGPGPITIEAAILSLNNSFTVDKWWCGDEIGDLTVRGAIAQRFRGTVGRIGQSGYIKKYEYDDRLRFRSPPRFLDPVQAAWRILTYVEQVPAAS